MNEIQAGPNDLLDTTDSLEAVGVFKGWKNFFFIIVVLCLLLLQLSFWLVDRGCIQLGPSAEAAEPVDEGESALPQGEERGRDALATMPVEPNLGPVVPAPVEPAEPVERPSPAPEPPAPAQPDEMTAEPNQVAEPNRPAEPNADLHGLQRPGTEKHGLEHGRTRTHPRPSVFASVPVSVRPRLQRAITWPSVDFLSGITAEQFAWMIRLVNAVLVLAASLYCLTLMFSLKVSMHGRLGGINHISRAFFLSLLMLVLLLPWQKVFGSVVTGAIYTPTELMSWRAAEKTGDTLAMVLYYLRFSGYGALIFLLLLLSQYRSLRWAKAILRRLEII